MLWFMGIHIRLYNEKIDLDHRLNSLNVVIIVRVRKFPNTTPSGLSIGIIFIIHWFNIDSTYFLPEVNSFMIPYTIYDPQV